MRRWIRLVEAHIQELMDPTVRDRLGDTGGPPKAPRRGEGPGPQQGTFWVRGTTLVPITGKSNAIINLSGQVVMLDPEKYGLTSDEIMAYLKQHPYGQPGHQPADEYTALLAGTDHDVSRVALLWRSSKLTFEMMLKQGWVWARYQPPESIHFVVSPSFAKTGIASSAGHFSMMQIDDILVTEARDLVTISDRAPHANNNRTYVFSSDDFPGFGGPFNALMAWTTKRTAPANSYLYRLVNDLWLSELRRNGLTASRIKVRTKNGYRERLGIPFLHEPPSPKNEGDVVIRVPGSIAYRMGMLISEPNRKGISYLYGTEPRGYAGIPADEIEMLTPQGWKPIREE